MSITADQERRFYDEQYAAFAGVPDSALICNRATLLADLTNPQRAIYERRLLYGTILERLLREPLKTCNALDYGCGTGDWGLFLASEGARVTLLDLSPVAIQLGLRRAQAGGVAERVRGVARDASDLSCFADGEFDLIYASAAVHHTLKYPHALAELVRVLRPGGKVFLAETYGNNRLLNFARRLRWKLAGEAAEQGEEILLSDKELALLAPHFRRMEVIPLNLLAMAKRAFRGRFHNPAVRAVLRGLEAADSCLLALCPPLRRYCGEAVIIAEK